MEVYYIILAFIAGACAPTQAGINAQLGSVAGDPSLAAMISFIVGAAGLTAYVLVTGVSWPSIRIFVEAPWWLWTGGLLGAILVFVSIVLAPKLGATATLGLIVAGQMIVSVILDHYGLVGYEEHHVNLSRILGVVLLLSGVILIKKF
ncbi:MAG: DMT family transporter [Pseudomonadota bacterium]